MEPRNLSQAWMLFSKHGSHRGGYVVDKDLRKKYRSVKIERLCQLPLCFLFGVVRHRVSSKHEQRHLLMSWLRVSILKSAIQPTA